MTTLCRCRVPLPPGYRIADFLAFHGRDAAQTAEQVTADSLRKGLVWQRRPACLTVRFTAAAVEATLDGDPPPPGAEPLETLLRRMLGLTQPIAAFERAYARHPDLGRLIARHPGLRLPVSASAFEALIWAVAGQQISVQAALSLRRKVIETANIRHSSGLLCHPDAAALAALTPEQLRAAGFSRSKAATAQEIAARLQDGRLRLEAAADPGDEERLRQSLLAIPGIGPWTVSYALLRGFGLLDGSLHGDVAVRRGLQSLLNSPTPPTGQETELWLAPFRPWRALVAAHLWAWKSAQAY